MAFSGLRTRHHRSLFTYHPSSGSAAAPWRLIPSLSSLYFLLYQSGDRNYISTKGGACKGLDEEKYMGGRLSEDSCFAQQSWQQSIDSLN